MPLSFPWRLRALAVTGVVAGLVLTTTPSYAAIGDNPLKTWGANGRVKAMVVVGGSIYIGGDFTSVTDTSGHSHPASRLAQINAATGAVNTSWQGSANDSVYSLAALGNTLYVGGAFSTVNGVSHRSVAAVSLTTGALVSTFRTTANKPVDGLAAAGGAVFLGGTFTSVTDATGSTARTYVAKVDAVTGTVDKVWAPRPDLRVRAIESDGVTVYLGGDFTTINGISNRSTAATRVIGTGAPLSSYKGGATNNRNYSPVLNMDLEGNSLYLAVAGGGGACTALNATSGARVWSKHSNGNVQDVTYNHGVVYCGGHFGGTGAFDGLTRYKAAAVQATAPYNVTSWAPRFNSGLGIWAMAADATHTYAGGDFTKVNQKTVQHFAQFADS